MKWYIDALPGPTIPLDRRSEIESIFSSISDMGVGIEVTNTKSTHFGCVREEMLGANCVMRLESRPTIVDTEELKYELDNVISHLCGGGIDVLEVVITHVTDKGVAFKLVESVDDLQYTINGKRQMMMSIKI